MKPPAAAWVLAIVLSIMVTGSRAAIPPQIIPAVPELGTPNFSMPGSSNDSSSSRGSSPPYSGTPGSGSAYNQLLSQTYGAQVVAAAQAEGINPDTLAAFAQIESHFQNVGNGSSSAQGVWQITNGTWDQYASELGLSDADRSDPAVQAQVASAIINSYANSVSAYTDQPATGVQVYGAYMFGSTAGEKLASATDPDTPLSQIVPASELAANNMTGWTVQQYRQTVAARMGGGASETVKS
jgi:hypothetical protein